MNEDVFARVRVREPSSFSGVLSQETERKPNQEGRMGHRKAKKDAPKMKGERGRNPASGRVRQKRGDTQARTLEKEYGVDLSVPPNTRLDTMREKQMPIFDFDQIEDNRPELFFALAAAVGTPVDHFCNVLSDVLAEPDYGYQAKTIHVSSFLDGLGLESPEPGRTRDEYERISRQMNRGNELRRITGGGDALALLVAAHINAKRRGSPPRPVPGRAFIIRQLKHPDEVLLLRQIYGSALHVVGIYCGRVSRLRNLEVHDGMSSERAECLVRRDEEEGTEWGQQLRDTFHRADFFVPVPRDGDHEVLRQQLRRYLNLLFGNGFLSPSEEEYGMFLAAASAFRSLSLSRQVGAAIVSPYREVVSLGTNEVPRYGGGQYWSDGADYRDHVLEYDSNDRMKLRILEEVLSATDPEWKRITTGEREKRLQDAASLLKGARLMNLIEFGRSLHAEMEAISAAGRVGVPVRGATLYTTVFPCHDCAKHIVGAGLERVVYVEPYPKSLAGDLHKDAIALTEDVEDGDVEGKVRFEPFLGVAPRRYVELFRAGTEEGRRISRKDEKGKVKRDELGLRRRERLGAHIEREAVAAAFARRMLKHFRLVQV